MPDCAPSSRFWCAALLLLCLAALYFSCCAEGDGGAPPQPVAAARFYGAAAATTRPPEEQRTAADVEDASTARREATTTPPGLDVAAEPWTATPPSSGGLADDFQLSATTQEYYDVFGATSLASVMPAGAGWRTDDGYGAAPALAAGGDDPYAGFSRYSIQKTRNDSALRSAATMRRGESTRNNSGRTLGYQSFLRGAPARPTPQGGEAAAVVFNDSDMRLSQFAAAGRR